MTHNWTWVTNGTSCSRKPILSLYSEKPVSKQTLHSPPTWPHSFSLWSWWSMRANVSLHNHTKEGRKRGMEGGERGGGYIGEGRTWQGRHTSSPSRPGPPTAPGGPGVPWGGGGGSTEVELSSPQLTATGNLQPHPSLRCCPLALGGPEWEG